MLRADPSHAVYYERCGLMLVLGEVAPLQSALRITERATLYDYQWYPRMQASEAATACILSTARDHPIVRGGLVA